MTYDPAPDIAALIDELHEAASDASEAGLPGSLITGPYARLRGGLLLDEQGREHISTENALRELLAAPDPARPCIVCGNPLPHETCGPVIIGTRSRR
jgi:hypothetical protein